MSQWGDSKTFVSAQGEITVCPLVSHADDISQPLRADDTIIDRLYPASPLFRRLWQPVAVAALNTGAEAGSARLYWRLLRETLGRGGGAGWLHHRQHHHHRPHPDASDGTDQQRQRKPHPCLTRVGDEGGRIFGWIGGCVHGAQLRRGGPPGQAP